MKRRTSSFVNCFVLVAGVMASMLTVPTASAASPSTFIKDYSDIVNKVRRSITPADVQATADGGSIALALADGGVNWLVKLGPTGTPQWQRELGVFGLPPGDFTYGVSVRQTADGGYIVGGGTIGGGSTGACAESGIQCAVVEKLDSTGKVVWAKAYPAGAGGSAITQINQSTDGGYIAVGSTTDLDQNTGALIFKLDAVGTVLWQRRFGPATSSQAYFNAVQQTADGGYVATGEFSKAGEPITSVLVVKFDPSGKVSWQRGFNNVDRSGSPSSSEHALAITQTSDGGYLVAGNWVSSTFPGQCCAGALLLKLTSSGNVLWQKAHSGGVYCYFNGFNQTCTTIGGVFYSVHPSADGGFVLAGAGQLKLSDSVPQVPWMAKVDASGNLLWQHLYYEAYAPTGRPLSQYFATSIATADGGTLALGFTENYSDGKGRLYAVKTDGAGLVGACSQVYPAPALTAIDPALTQIAPSLSITTTRTQGGGSPSTTRTTSVGTSPQC